MPARSSTTSNKAIDAHAKFAAVALVVVMALGMWQVIAALARMDFGDVPAGSADFREGRTTGKLQRKIEDGLPWRDAMIAAASALRYELAGGSVETVRVGREGWLFLGDELQFADESAAWNRERIAKIAEVKRALDARGVSLVVALVPDKARVYSRFVPGSDVPPAHAARYGEALAALRARGVNAIDLLAPLAAGAREGEVYYRTDTHWNQRGARIAADTIARAVGSSGVKMEPAKFTNRVDAEVERPGDLIRLMGLEHAPKILRPAADRERPITTQAVDAGASLLGDFEIPATLIGTSYSLRANFHGFLQEALGARVLNAARDGSGFYQSANEYFANEAFRASPPKVVIWEIPERVLSEKPASPEALPLGGTPSRPPA